MRKLLISIGLLSFITGTVLAVYIVNGSPSLTQGVVQYVILYTYRSMLIDCLIFSTNGEVIMNESNLIAPTSTVDVVAPVAQFDSVATRLITADKELGTWYPYDPTNVPAEIEGTRSVKCMYKTAKDKVATHANSYALVPVAHITPETVAERIEELAPYFVEMLQDVEDKHVKAMHKDNASCVHTEYFSIDKCIELMEEAGQGARMNGEQYGQWFDANLASTIELSVCTKLELGDNATPDQLSKVLTFVQAYKDKFTKLASPKTVFPDTDCEAMTRVMQLAEAEDTTIGKRITARLSTMKVKKEDALLAL
jgi:hypothetical protein